MSLFHSIKPLPKASAADCAVRPMQEWQKLAAETEDASLRAAMHRLAQDERSMAALENIFSYSPHLSLMALQYPAFLMRIYDETPEAVFQTLIDRLHSAGQEIAEPALMQLLRESKAQASLLIALADIAGYWPLERVTGALSELAEACLSAAVKFLLRQLHNKGEWVLPRPETPERGCGLIVLGMGKLGGKELNYSSDIDLIILYDKDRIDYHGKQSLQYSCNRIAASLVKLMQERTADGYVFRTDLRLRPDPASTPPAINVNGAYTYYESLGQNWERAALIKARPVAGDQEAGEIFLKNLTPFLWRKHLDFAAIEDIQSIKRQMDSRAGVQIALPGHNIKLGVGGIREIEFFTQIHQLIWGGRMPAIRTRSTCETLGHLVEMELLDAKTGADLQEAYGLLRRIEHRLQMVRDEQTHALPADPREMEAIARFSGYDNFQDFSAALLPRLHRVHMVYAHSFQGAERLGGEGALVFTGVENDPQTLRTIAGMGFENAAMVSEVIQSWHRGARRATRTKRAREMITELTPALLRALADTSNPEAAFLKFDEFLGRLPAGVQLFSLFYNNPQLLELIAAIMGSAPAIAEHLSKNPNLLDTALSRGFYLALPTRDALDGQLSAMLSLARDVEDKISVLQRFRQEKYFQAGVHLLKSLVRTDALGVFLTEVAELILTHLTQIVREDFAATYGVIDGAQFAIIGLGKLGAAELTFGSDLDLVFVYDAKETGARSNGERSVSASVYFHRLSQRFIGILSALGAEGKLYDVDTRLRPSGGDGMLAVSLRAFNEYFSTVAWTFEYMALSRARPVAGDTALCKTLQAALRTHLLHAKQETLAEDVVAMREKVDKEFAAANPWDIKYVRGGGMDLDFIGQFLLLKHLPSHRGLKGGGTLAVFRQLLGEQCISQQDYDRLAAAWHVLNDVLGLLRLCHAGAFDEQSASPGLKRLLAQSFAEADIDALKTRLVNAERTVYAAFLSMVR